MQMNKVIKAIEDIKNGKMVIVVDHEDRENEGDFIVSAEKATADDINFMNDKFKLLHYTGHIKYKSHDIFIYYDKYDNII